MEGDTREGTHPNTGGDQTSVGSELSTGFESGERGRVRNIASTVKGKAAGIPALFADGLQAGAEAIRQRRSLPAPAVSASRVTALVNDPGIAAVTDTLASGMQSSADWLRDADLGKLKEGVEKQVKEHPARALLVALGAGFLIGKVLRR